MKHTIPAAVIILLLGACDLFFSSCATNQVRNPQPPVTISNSDTTTNPQTNQAVVPVPAAGQTTRHAKALYHHSHKAIKALAKAHPAAPAAPAPLVIPGPAVSTSVVPTAVMVSHKSKGIGDGWLWLLLLLLLLALGSWLWSRSRSGQKILAKRDGFNDKGFLAEGAGLTEAEKTAKRDESNHKKALAAKHTRSVRKALLAKVAQLARKVLLAKRARAVRRGLLARRARLAHDVLLAKRARAAHKAYLAKRNRLAHEEVLAENARLAHRALLARRSRLARKVILAKRARAAHRAILARHPHAEHPLALVKHPRTAHKAIVVRHPRALVKHPHTAHKAASTKHPRPVHEVIAAKRPPVAHPLALVKRPKLAAEEILVEGPGLAEVIKVSVIRAAKFEEIIVSVAQIGNFPAKKAYIFLENGEAPLNPNHLLDAKHPDHKVLHVHTQTEIGVAVSFNGLEHKTNFSPATTVEKVMAWAATEFEINGQEVSRVSLAIRGSSESLQDTAHIGRFVPHDKNKLELNVLTSRTVMTKV